ncbi:MULTISPECIES: hypothetical protein [Sulfurovum]|uniref:LPXTG-motif cell wall anchor domain-containing protein n=1 Tax=Sulfurovum xiamenensis TaxID=3019066 RepID=A0ABT7QQU5_9BACT|nr:MULTISPECIES: hypothetical protein [Sulfurovum]EIF51709.1 hypothetical protein SULAR_02558 [Sulfurovum sp. AR]MDM5263453.1 hypothetical protein [Sulfurovum xiamenensis]
MNAIKIFGIILIIAGALGLAYSSFSYTKDTDAIKVGPVEMTVEEKQTVQIPVWAGAGAIVLGGLILLFGNRRS